MPSPSRKPGLIRTCLRAELAFLAPLALAGCASEPQRPAPSPTMQAEDPTRYACNDGTFLSVRFRDDAALVTLVDGAIVSLPRAAAGAGFRYASERMELRGRDDAATWSTRGSAATSCIAT